MKTIIVVGRGVNAVDAFLSYADLPGELTFVTAFERYTGGPAARLLVDSASAQTPEFVAWLAREVAPWIRCPRPDGEPDLLQTSARRQRDLTWKMLHASSGLPR